MSALGRALTPKRKNSTDGQRSKPTEDSSSKLPTVEEENKDPEDIGVDVISNGEEGQDNFTTPGPMDAGPPDITSHPAPSS